MEDRGKIVRVLLKILLVVVNFTIQTLTLRFAIILPFEVFIASGGQGMERMFMLLLGILIGTIGLSIIAGLWVALIMFWTLIDETI